MFDEVYILHHYNIINLNLINFSPFSTQQLCVIFFEVHVLRPFSRSKINVLHGDDVCPVCLCVIVSQRLNILPDFRKIRCRSSL